MEQVSPRAKAEEALQSLGQTSLPVDVEKVAERHKITVVREHLEDEVSGFVVRKKTGVYIGINSGHPLNRQRFTLAHELGHFFMHIGEDEKLYVDGNTFFRNQTSTSGENTEEIQANNFAAELLMPRTLIEKEIENIRGEIDDLKIFKFANKFKVSDQAMRFRLINLGYLTAQ